MKNSKNRQNFKYYVVALGVFLFVSVFLSYYFRQDFNPEKIVKQVQEKIYEKDIEINRELAYLKSISQKNPDSVFSVLDRYKFVYEAKGYVFLVLDHDSLIFWSDNKVPLKAIQQNPFSDLVNTGNGFYRTISMQEGEKLFIGIYLIKQSYNYQNEYLENEFHPTFELAETVKFNEDESGEYSIKTPQGKYLFSLSFDSKPDFTEAEINILFVLYLITLLLIIACTYELYLFIYFKTGKFHLFLFGFIADLILLRVLIFYFEIPRVLYQSKLFTPFYYANSDLIPSIGDLFVNVLFLLIISFFIYSHVKFHHNNLRKKSGHKYFLIFSLFLHNFIFFKGIEFIFRSLIIDSNISLDLNNIFSLSQMSFFSFLIIAAFALSYFLISAKLSFFAYKYSKNLFYYSGLLFLVLGVSIVFGLIRANLNIWYASFVFLYIFSFGVFFRKNIYQFNLGNIVFYILLFSIISTYSLHKFNSLKEKEYRKLLAVHLSSEQRDPLAEYIFQNESDNIYNDERVLEMLNNYGHPDFDQSRFEDYFVRNFFLGYWKKYDYQITICNDQDILDIQPENIAVNCNSFFEDKIEIEGIPTESPELFFMKYAAGENGYVAIFDFSNSVLISSSLKLYIEFFPKYVARDLGFPDLLVNDKIRQNPDLANYSYAKYKHDELYKRVGEYFYTFDIKNYQHNHKHLAFFNQNGYNHLYYKINDYTGLIISKKQKSFADLLAPFSYLFLFFIIFSGLVFFLFIFPFSDRKIKLNFRTRLQMSMSFVILFSFLVIGIFTLFYINNLNDQKNQDILREKTHSVLVEMQHKFADVQVFDEETTYSIEGLLVKFSNVFFTDINLFDLQGRLIATSRPQIYEEQLISPNINSEAYKALAYENSSLYIHLENIGKQKYLSAYIPFINSMGEVIAYLNLPYFAKENDLRKEISTFLVTYINIYVILIALSLLIALLISNYISRPLKMIITKIKQVKLGGQNELISWKKQDEIGQLVEEYNRMIEELAQSAELLAKSERESAWREMAKQVAHEIKNPLTPMKLSVQYLQRAWQNQSPDYEKRLDKFTQTMIEQIDTLSAIASEFSDFAKMPLSKKENIDLVEIINSSISLYKNYHQINFAFYFDEKESLFIFADKEQLLRAFSNLFKNSIQAIDKKKGGKIDISLQKRIKTIEIQISDNGGGISDAIAGKIFSPNFTTKSGGMGLGLAIVKNIVQNSGGDISYTSVEGQGTTFSINFPAA